MGLDAAPESSLCAGCRRGHLAPLLPAGFPSSQALAPYPTLLQHRPVAQLLVSTAAWGDWEAMSHSRKLGRGLIL